MDSEFICRLCGLTGEISHKHPPCEKTKFSRDIGLALNVNIENGSTDFPKFICQACKMKLVRW